MDRMMGLVMTLLLVFCGLTTTRALCNSEVSAVCSGDFDLYLLLDT